MTLTKDDIVKTVQNSLDIPKNRSAQMVETVLEFIKDNLGRGEDVLISGFGKFCIKDKNQRRGRNPATGEDLLLDARKVVTFRCSPLLRDKVNYEES